MADQKISALTAATSVAAADQFAIVQSGASKMATGSMARGYLTNGSTATVSAGYVAETYIAGSAIVIPTAGGWRVNTVYRCAFDMVKTAAGTAAIAVNVRLGTTGTNADGTGAINMNFAVGTAAVDTGIFEVWAVFRTIGSGTAANVQAIVRCTHHLAATGLVSTGASGIGILTGATGGFNSTTPTTIGCTFTGGASFSGTNTYVDAELFGF